MDKDFIEKSDEQEKLGLLQAISLTVAKADTIELAFEEVLGHICRFMGWPLGHVYIWSEAANALVSSRVWFMEDASTIAPFRRKSEATHFKRGEGTLGRVWESGDAIFILDVRKEDVFVRQLPVDEDGIGIRAYFAFPIIVEGRVTAVLEFFSPVSSAPDKDVTSVINHVSILLALAMQRQETLADLRLSKAQLAESQRTAQLGHWELDILKRHLTWSPELYRIFGVSPESFETSFENVMELIHQDDLAFVESKIQTAYETGIPFEFFHRIDRPDGVERVLHSRGRPVYDRAGTIIKLVGTAQDMTEMKEVEVKLAKSVRQLSALMEIGQAVAATMKLEQIYDKMLSSIRPLIEAESVILFIEDGGSLKVAAMNEGVLSDIRGLRVPLDSGIVGNVWQSGQSEFLRGEACRERLSPILKTKTGYEPGAMLAVAICWQDNTVGVLEAVHRDQNAFDEGDLQLLEMAAVWTAIAIANARQYQQLQERLEESEAILAISNAMTEVYDLDNLLQLIAECAQDIVRHADWAAIHLLHPKTRQLELVASAGIDLDEESYLMNPGEGIAGLVISEGGVINVPNLEKDPRWLPAALRTKAKALLAAPVETQRERIGIISVQGFSPDVFTKDEERLLTIFGVQAGMAIENVRLIGIQTRAREKADKQKKRMQELARRVVQAQEQERSRIARELHDESGQSLTSLKISLDMIISSLPEDLTEVREGLANIMDLTDKTMTNLRLLSHNLRPIGLDSYGLDASLSGLCQDFFNHTPIEVVYEGVELPDLAPLTALSLYRFVQEALTNAIKYAQANEIKVTLVHDSDMIKLTVEDDGVGFTPPNLSEDVTWKGTGLLGMIERLEMVDGQMFLESELGKGSCLTAVVPYVNGSPQIG